MLELRSPLKAGPLQDMLAGSADMMYWKYQDKVACVNYKQIKKFIDCNILNCLISNIRNNIVLFVS